MQLCMYASSLGSKTAGLVHWPMNVFCACMYECMYVCMLCLWGWTSWETAGFMQMVCIMCAYMNTCVFCSFWMYLCFVFESVFHFVCVFTCVLVYSNVALNACSCACTCEHTYIHVHIHIHTHRGISQLTHILCIHMSSYYCHSVRTQPDCSSDDLMQYACM